MFDYLQGAILPDKRGIHAVLSGSFESVGLSIDDAGIDSRHDLKVLGLPRAKRVCVVLVDGLGSEQLIARRGHARNLRNLNIDNFITSVIPATTAAGITSFGTGKLPGQTSMAGYALKSPVNDRVFSLISWNDTIHDPQEWQREPTLFELLGERTRETVLIQPAKFIGSGLTLAALRGVRALSAESLSDRVEAAVSELRSGTKMCYLYWGNLDSIGHKHGWESEQWINELELFDSEFGVLLRRLPPDTLVVLTADHGMIDAGAKIDIASSPELRQDIDVVAGEERAFQIYTRDGDGVATRWRDAVGDHAWVLTKEEVISHGLLGPVNDLTKTAIGDVIVFSKDSTGFVDSRVHSTSAINMVGVHGSLTPAEMHIPLIVEVV
ncbi:alkaline phosphatase family protein [Arcanobacterium ihumii]|uniref:alkaline phosphatase family protein n=1 Tax=Arcanobacterium ihumii TaxID=2138162 RepID=UPI001F2CBE7D|nr:alkaline phosphatase family protein [Arcanobacterium ihumii]